MKKVKPGLIKMDYGVRGYNYGYELFKKGFPIEKLYRYKAKWRNDAVNLGIELGWEDAKDGKERGVMTYNPETTH
jgi:hypothetical protein